MSETNLVTFEEQMSKLTTKDLEKLCKENAVTYYVGKRHLTKAEIIEKLKVVLSDAPLSETEKVEEPNPIVEKVEEKEKVTEWVNSPKDSLIEEAEPGTLIAFYDAKGKPRTAALVNRSSSRRLVKLVTEFNWEFVVPYENVLWVRKGNRWPKGIYNLLKGYKHGKENTKEN